MPGPRIPSPTPSIIQIFPQKKVKEEKQESTNIHANATEVEPSMIPGNSQEWLTEEEPEPEKQEWLTEEEPEKQGFAEGKGSAHKNQRKTKRRRSKSKSLEPESSAHDSSIRMQKDRPKAQISYKEAKEFLKDPMVVETVERRHITLGWQLAGNVGPAIRRLIFSATIGQYRPSVGGIPIAIGEVNIIKPMYILEDHNCIHLDVDVQMIILKVQPGQHFGGDCIKEIWCKAHTVYPNQVTGTAFGNIGMVCIPAPPWLKAGNAFKARMTGIAFKKSLCQIKCVPLGVKRFV